MGKSREPAGDGFEVSEEFSPGRNMSLLTELEMVARAVCYKDGAPSGAGEGVAAVLPAA
jgi:hypothetical protein